MVVLGIESSCDDTAAAIVDADGAVLSSIVSSQDAIHGRFGGVVPELASRKHLESIVPIVDQALASAAVELTDIDLIAVTQGPGLIGSLLVGFSYAKALSHISITPCIGVDHMAGHLLSVFLEDPSPSFPYIALIVSGGTTSLFQCTGFTEFRLLGRTRDDAAGEAFDKVAKMLDLGYPGGPAVSRVADSGDRQRFAFPRAWLEENSLDFSFSGLKTAVFNQWGSSTGEMARRKSDICASFQEAVVDVLVQKTLQAAVARNISTVVLGGGVSANPRLRLRMEEACSEHGCELFVPSPRYCTDNGAMIAFAGLKQFQIDGKTMAHDADVFSRSKLG